MTQDNETYTVTLHCFKKKGDRVRIQIDDDPRLDGGETATIIFLALMCQYGVQNRHVHDVMKVMQSAIIRAKDLQARYMY